MKGTTPPRHPAPGTRPARRPEPRAPRPIGRTPSLEGRIDSFELAFRMQTAAPAVAGHLGRDRRDPQALRHRRQGNRQLRPPVPDGPPVRRSAACGSCRCTHSYKWDQHGDLKTRPRATTRCEVDQPIAGLLTDLKARGLLEGHAGPLGRRVRPHARRRKGTTAATTIRTASPCGWPAAA